MDTLHCSLQKYNEKSALVYNKSLSKYYFVDINRGCCQEIKWEEYRRLHQNYQRVTEDVPISKKVKSIIKDLQLVQ